MAKIIKFIGFGFDEDNLRAIGFPSDRQHLMELLAGKTIQYLNYKGENRSVANAFEELNLTKSFNLQISLSPSISYCYYNDFRTPF